MGKVFVVDPDSKKLPYELTVIIFMCAFLDFFCMNQIMPNVPFMVADYFPDLDTTQIGYYSGYLTACYNLGGIVGNLIWGWFSDTYGRKPTIVISLTCTAVFCQLFGLAPNYTLAIIFRTCWGLMNSTVGVVKTYIAEMCNAHTVAKGFSVMSSAGGLARIVGPLVGGFLSKPEENFPSLVRLMPWLRKVRYWIPCFVGGVLCLFTAIFTAFVAPETVSREAAKKAKEDKKKNALRVKEINEKKDKGDKLTLEEEMLVDLSRDTYFDLIRNRNIIIACTSYALVSFVQSAQDSLLSLYLINDAEHGGFGFDQTDIGWLYTGIGPIQISMVFFTAPMIYPQVAQLCNYQDIYFGSGLIYAALLLLYPCISLVNTASMPIRWFVVLIATMSCIFSRLVNFTTSNVLINNSTYADFRGKVNGLGQVLAAVGRFAGPSIGSNIFAWSIATTRPFPFNYGFTYYILGIMMIGIAYFVYLLPKSVNNPKGKIADDYKKRGQEMKEMKEVNHDEKEVVSISETKVEVTNDQSSDMTITKPSEIPSETTNENQALSDEKPSANDEPATATASP